MSRSSQIEQLMNAMEMARIWREGVPVLITADVVGSLPEILALLASEVHETRME